MAENEFDALFNEYTKGAQEVYQVISDYFGEELTDYQDDELRASKIIDFSDHESSAAGIKVLIKFPSVRVTNEDGNYVDIDNLFVKIELTNEGTLRHRFKMLRTSYTRNQWASAYVHSHANFYSGAPANFADVCLGSGPLVRTCETLRDRFCQNKIEMWGLFCFELEKYVHVESKIGIPYNRLENISKGEEVESLLKSCPKETGTHNTLLGNDIVNQLLKDYLKDHKIKVGFKDGKYTLGEPYVNLWLDISNFFIKWYPIQVRKNRVMDARSREYIRRANVSINDLYIDQFIIDGSRVYAKDDNNNRANNELEGTDLFVFKGVMQKLRITDGASEKSYDVKLLKSNVFKTILFKLFEIINSRYGKTKDGRKYVYL